MQENNDANKPIKDKVFWIIGTAENYLINTSAWVNCPGIGRYVEDLSNDDNYTIRGIVFSRDRIGFLLENNIEETR